MPTLPDTTPVDITSDYSFTASKEILQAKYTDAIAWAQWAAGMLNNNITDVTLLLGSDTVDADIAALTAEIGAIIAFSPGTISGGTGDFTSGNTALTNLQSRLATDIATYSTGLGTTVETAMFARETARQNAQRTAAYNEITTFYSANGFDIPPGALTAKQTEANNETSLRLADSSSEILKLSATLAADYNKSMLSAAIQLQSLLADVFNSKELRTFEASKATVMLAAEVYKNTLGLYSTKAELILKKGELALTSKARQLQLEVTTLAGLAQNASQLVAAALNGVSVSSSFGWSASAKDRDPDLATKIASNEKIAEMKITPPGY